MNLTLMPLKESRAIKIVLKSKGKSWEEVAQNGEDIVPTLDKMFKAAKMTITLLAYIKPSSAISLD